MKSSIWDVLEMLRWPSYRLLSHWYASSNNEVKKHFSTSRYHTDNKAELNLLIIDWRAMFLCPLSFDVAFSCDAYAKVWMWLCHSLPSLVWFGVHYLSTSLGPCWRQKDNLLWYLPGILDHVSDEKDVEGEENEWEQSRRQHPPCLHVYDGRVNFCAHQKENGW